MAGKPRKTKEIAIASRKAYEMLSSGKLRQEVANELGYSKEHVGKLANRYANENNLPKNWVERRTGRPKNTKVIFIKGEVLVADGLRCEVIREYENTYAVKSRLGTGLVLKDGLHLVGELQTRRETITGRSFSGKFGNHRKTGTRSI